MPADTPLTAAEIRDLRAFAGTIIPASGRYGVPGADDETIFADIVKSLGRDREDIGLALSNWRTWPAAPSPIFRPSAALVVANELRAEGGLPLAALTRVDAALLLPRRPGDALARPGAAPALPHRPCRRAGRLVAARPGEEARAVLPALRDREFLVSDGDAPGARH